VSDSKGAASPFESQGHIRESSSHSYGLVSERIGARGAKEQGTLTRVPLFRNPFLKERTSACSLPAAAQRTFTTVSFIADLTPSIASVSGSGKCCWFRPVPFFTATLNADSCTGWGVDKSTALSVTLITTVNQEWVKITARDWYQEKFTRYARGKFKCRLSALA
jgi:hypothetical protein